MTIGTHLRIVGVFIGISLCGLVDAQTMYRCGSVYQDRPCDGGQQGKVIGSTGGRQPAYKPVADAECAQRGANTLKIVWSREAGASAEKQIADIDAGRPASPRSWEDKRLVMEVFNKRGSASEVRAAIEADCMLEKERAAQAAALIGAAQALTGKPQPAPVTTLTGDNDADTKAADARQSEARERANKKSRCDELNARLAGIRNSQRTGGDIREMESLNQKSRDTEGQLREVGC